MSCPTPMKIRYKNALEACNALIAIKKRLKPGESGPARFYECRCGGWHLTSHAQPRKHETGIISAMDRYREERADRNRQLEKR